MNTANTGGIPSCKWPDAKRGATFRTCWDKDGCPDKTLQRRAAEDRIQAITKQLDSPHGLTNKERRALANERQPWERMFNLGIYSPVPVGEIDERKDRATEKKLRWLAKKKAAQVSPGPAVAPKPADQTPLERRTWPKSLAAVRMPLSGEILQILHVVRC